VAKDKTVSEAKENVRISEDEKSVVVENVVVANPLVVKYLSEQKAADRCAVIRRAIGIGVLALMEDRISAFFARTENELGTQMEYLKLIYQDREILEGTARKGTVAEREYSEVLQGIIREQKLQDTVSLTGATPEDEMNKTGDILVTVNDANLVTPRRIAIESKLVRRMSLGKIADRAVVADADTVLSQLLEMRANRQSDEQIIILDEATASDAVRAEVGWLRYFPEYGFVCVTDRARDNFEPLRIAYLLARRMVFERALAEKQGKTVKLRLDAINLVIERFFRNLDLLDTAGDSFNTIRKEAVKGTLYLAQMKTAVERDRDAVNKLLGNGGLTTEELFDVLEHVGLAAEWTAREAALKTEMKKADKKLKT